jgi:hypothetical protein
VPGLEVPRGAGDLVSEVWGFLRRYPFPDAGACPGGFHDDIFYDTAYLATHVGYVPTGCGRHRLRVEEAPGLYGFIRGNFYAVLELGELDLFAEFVDLLRQYGCTALDDFQVRAGTRWLLERYHAAGDRWMGHRDGGTESSLDAYTLIHKPWTGAGGVRERRLEPVTPGTYGWAFRRFLLDGRTPESGRPGYGCSASLP